MMVHIKVALTANYANRTHNTIRKAHYSVLGTSNSINELRLPIHASMSGRYETPSIVTHAGVDSIN